MDKDASEIRREIEATRARMGDTVDALGYKADVPARVKDAVNDRVETVRDSIGNVVETVKESVAGALGGATRGVAGAAGDLGHVTDKLGRKATNTMTSGLQDVSNKLPSPGDVGMAARRGVGIAVENPLGLALGALAAGFLAGLAAPVTEIERRTVGPLRDDLLDRAQSMGSEALEQGKQRLRETVESALRPT
jgi:hypothetical protein